MLQKVKYWMHLYFNFPVSFNHLNNKIMSVKISLSDFSFHPNGYGHYKVMYTSPVTSKSWSIVTNNMPLIDDTKNVDNPKIKDLVALKTLCKGKRFN